MCGGGGTQVSTSTTEPWAEQIPYLTAGFEQAKNIYDKAPPNYYPGETLAGFDPAQTAAHQATLGYAMGPRVASMQAGGADAAVDHLADRQRLQACGLHPHGSVAADGWWCHAPHGEDRYSRWVYREVWDGGRAGWGHWRCCV